MGAVTTTIYPSLLPNQIEYILNDSESKLVFVEDEMQLEKVKSVFEDCENLKKIIVMDNSFEGNDDYVHNLNSFLIFDKELISSSNLLFEDINNFESIRNL